MSTIKRVYAFCNEQEIVQHSSSGGAFSAICEVIDELGNICIYGAAFDSNFSVKHQRAETLKECEKFRGSKYVQSNMSGILPVIKKDLEDGKNVLFTGTPCQVFSVKQYCINKNINMENLFLVDIICHGAVVPDVWEKYKNWLEKKEKSKLVEFQFRYKGSRWKSYPTMARFDNKKKIVNTHAARMYTNLFFSALALRSSCYICKFANLDRFSDLTIGDFWGIENVISEFPRENGSSEILVNSDKGQWIAEQIKKLPKINIQECLTDDYIKYQHNLNCPTERPINEPTFKKELKEKDFKYILKRYAGNTFMGKVKHCIRKTCGEFGIISSVKRRKRQNFSIFNMLKNRSKMS